MQSVEHPLAPEEVSEYLDGELPSERAAAVEQHLAGCAACQKVRDDLAGVSRDLAAWTIEGAPGTLQVDRLEGERNAPGKSASDQSWRPRWLPAWTLLPTAGVAGAVVLALATFVTKAPMENSSANESAASRKFGAVAPQASAALAEEVRPGGSPSPKQVSVTSPRVIRTATLRLLSKDFDGSRAAIDRIVAGAGGYLGEVNITGVRPQARALRATVRVPSARLDAVLAALKALGEVIEESQAADDVTEQMVDLEARIANGRNTEQRMNELLRTRTGKLSEVLEAEREVARVREEIERLDAQRKNLEGRVTFSAITLQLNEEPKSSLNLGPLPLTARLRNAFVDGFRTAFESAVNALLFALQVAPAALFWLLVIGVPARIILRRRARASA